MIPRRSSVARGMTECAAPESTISLTRSVTSGEATLAMSTSTKVIPTAQPSYLRPSTLDPKQTLGRVAVHQRLFGVRAVGHGLDEVDRVVIAHIEGIVRAEHHV